jgi:amidase
MGWRRGLAAAAGVVAVLTVSQAARAAGIDPARATIVQLQAALASGRINSVRLVRFYLARIRRLDSGAGGLHAVIVVNPAALSEAAALDAERRAKGARSPLHGIPILVKDNIDAAGMPTTAGSLALARNLRPDAPVVARLRAAGAIILGKTNLSEWANFRSSHATSGWSAVGGLTRNPYAPDRTACGSSSGSAAAVAAGFAPAALGSETDGSVTCPSAMNGLAGLKPSVGMVPRTGVVPISFSQDTVGPIARSVQDLAVLMAAITGPDARDTATSGAPAFAAAAPVGLRGVRLGVWQYPNDGLWMVDAPYQAALARLRAAGAVLVPLEMPDTTKIEADEAVVLKTELKTGLAAYLRDAPTAVTARSLADLIAFNTATPAEMSLFGQDLFEQSQATRGLDDPAYLAARQDSVRLSGAEGIDRLLRQNRLQALIAPTTGPAWLVDMVYGDNGAPAVSTLPAVAGYPHLTVPMGMVQGLPVGLSFIGTRWTDARLLALGAAWQALAPAAVAPRLR